MEQIPTEKDSIIEHMKMINYLKSLYSGKKFFVECYPTDTNAQCFPNSNRAVKEIELPYFKLHDLLTKECEGKEKEIAELKKKWMECFTESALIILKNKAKISELEAEKAELLKRCGNCINPDTGKPYFSTLDPDKFNKKF